MPVVAELFAGIEFSHTREEDLNRLRRFLATTTIWPFDRRAAEEYGAHLCCAQEVRQTHAAN
jgi:predicted nucleic acid-binding protein